MAQLRQTKNEIWQQYVIDFLFANYDFEYFNPQRESYLELRDSVCNRIIFPKAENGRLVSNRKLEFLIDAIQSDDVLSEKIFGPDNTEKGKVYLVETPIAINIVWNELSSSSYDLLDKEKLDQLYRY